MLSIAIIPARGGSKRIERKNIKEFNGKPIIVHAIDLAIQSKLFHEVMVSTDDDEIESIAIMNNAKVPFKRSIENSNDFATLTDVLIEVLMKYKELGKNFDTVCCILPTAALISQIRLKEGYDKLMSGKFNAIVPVIKFAYPIQRALKNHGGFLKMREPDHYRSRSQDLESYFHDSGQFYWIETETLLYQKTLFTSKAGYVELEETEAQDVDNILDWKMLEIKYDFLKKTIK
ncbi:MAG: pseudaminic acid cytidylyltransferase [Bacteroidota bacterium]